MFSVTALAIECSIQSFPILDQSEEFQKAKQRFNKSCQKASNRVIQPTVFDEDKPIHDGRTEHIHEEQLTTRKQLRQQRLDELKKKKSERPDISHVLPEEVDDGLDDCKPPVETMKGWDTKHLLYKILLQYEFSCELKMKFNQKLLHLKHEKEDIISFLIECKRRIREITDEIGYPYPEEYFSKLYIDLQNEKNGNTIYYEPYVMSQKKWFMHHSDIENLCGIDKEEFMRHHVLLRHEMNRLMLCAKERVSSFDTSMQQLKVEQDDLLVELHAQDIRLIALLQQLSIVIQTESKEKVLDGVSRKATEALDNVSRLQFEKQKEFHEIETNINELKTKESKREKQLQSILSKCILHYKLLQDLYNSDDEDHPFPPECPTKYYDSVSKLRRSRQVQEAKMQEFKNDLDAIHHDLNVLGEEKERSKKEAMIARENLHSFLEDKVAMLSKVKSTFVVRDGPIFNTRMDSTNFMVCSRSNFEVLKQKKKDVQTIISKEKSALKSLQLQHNKLKKESNAIEERMKQLHQDCDYIQKLKLGQVLELDALYSFLDSIDGDEDSNNVNDSQNLEGDMKLEISRAEKRLEELKMKLKDVVRTNTSLLQQVGTLHEKQKLYMSEKEKNAKHNRIPQHVHDKEIKELKKTVNANFIKIQGLRSAIERHQSKTSCTNDYYQVSTFEKDP
jgi:hypothetical protein